MTDGDNGFGGVVGRTVARVDPVVARAGASGPQGRPNVVLVLLDDMGFSDVGPFGSEIPTPTIDRLAAHGIRFTNYHTAPLCSPSRAAIQTGMNPHRAGFAGVANFDPGFPGWTMEISPDIATLPEVAPVGGLRDLRGRQVAPHPRRGHARRRGPRLLATPAGVRPLLRDPRGLDQPAPSPPADP